MGFLTSDLTRLLVGYLATPFMELSSRKVGILERHIIKATMLFGFSFFLLLLGSSIFGWYEWYGWFGIAEA
jgi:hypothetical protein